LPVELTLHSTGSGESLRVEPVRELKSLRETVHIIEPQVLKPGDNPLAQIHGDLLEIEAEIALGNASEISFDLRGVPVVYDVETQKVSCLGNQATLAPKDGKISLHIFVDRASVDIYGGDGSLYLPMAKALSPNNESLKLFCQGGDASIVSLKVYELKSAW
jgi:sucrose-6-phosphate hydrolase SacC (GH32 family)